MQMDDSYFNFIFNQISLKQTKFVICEFFSINVENNCIAMSFLKKLESIGEGVNDLRQAVDDFKSGNIVGGVKDLYSSAKDIGEVVVQQVKKKDDQNPSNQNNSKQNQNSPIQSQTSQSQSNQQQYQYQSNPQQLQTPSNQQQLQYQPQSQNYVQPPSNQTYDQQQALQVQQMVQNYQLLQQQFIQQSAELQQYQQYLQQLQSYQQLQQLQDQQKELEFQKKLKLMEDKLLLSTEKEKALKLKEMELERERSILEEEKKSMSMVQWDKLDISSNQSDKQSPHESSLKNQISSIKFEANRQKPVLIQNPSKQSPPKQKQKKQVQIQVKNSPILLQPPFQFQPQLQSQSQSQSQSQIQNPSQFTLPPPPPPPIFMQNQQFPLINPTQIQNPSLLQYQNLSKTQVPLQTQNIPQVPAQSSPQAQTGVGNQLQPQVPTFNQSVFQLPLSNPSQTSQNPQLNSSHGIPTIAFKPSSDAPIIFQGDICIKQNSQWSLIQSATITSAHFVNLPLSSITKAKIKAESGVPGFRNIKITSGNQDTLFSVPQNLQVEWTVKLIWGSLGVLKKSIDINAAFSGEIAGFLLKKVKSFGGEQWESRYVSIYALTGLKSAKSATSAPTILIKSLSEIWTRFQIVNGMYLGIKFVYANTKMEYAIPLENAVTWVRAFHSLIH